MKDRSALVLGGLLVLGGALHLIVPQAYDSIVPPFLPLSPRFWTIGSGIAELALGAMILRPSTRAAGALAAAVLFVAVFPANIWMAVDWADRPAPQFALALLRLPLQVPLVWWAVRVRRRAALAASARSGRMNP